METLQRTANRGSISTGGYEIDNSLKFEADNTEIIYRANESGTNRKTFTVSLWFKRTELGVDQEVWHGGRNGQTTVMGILSYSSADDNLWVDVGGGTGNTGTLYRSFTTRKIRDTSAWYHFVLAVDTTQATEANRMKVWLNGEEVTDWAQHQIPAQDFQCALESGTDMAWGGFRPSNVTLFSGYLAECHYLDGVAKVQTDFGEYDEDSGIWIPKKYTGTYGNNGCYMKYDDSSALGADSSGNGNNFTLNNISAADQATDTPTNNFCTLNQVMLTQANTVISQGATSLFSTGASGNTVVGTMGVSRGKWYWEFKHISAGGTAYWSAIGYTSSESTDSTQTAGGNSGYPSHVALLPNGGTFTNGTILGGKFNTFSPNDIAGVALDMDNGDMYLYKNGTIQNSGNPIFTSIGDFAMPVGSVYLNGCGGYFNFGGFTSYTPASAASDENGYGTFEYAPPSGYYALCTKNLAEFG